MRWLEKLLVLYHAEPSFGSLFSSSESPPSSLQLISFFFLRVPILIVWLEKKRETLLTADQKLFLVWDKQPDLLKSVSLIFLQKNSQ